VRKEKNKSSREMMDRWAENLADRRIIKDFCEYLLRQAIRKSGSTWKQKSGLKETGFVNACLDIAKEYN